MRKYDTTYIVNGTLDANDREALIEKFSDSLKKKGGKIERIIRWGMRTLSYEINKRNRGYYVILYYSADPSIIKSFERELSINESVLRYITLVFDGEHPSYIIDEGIKDEVSSYSKPQEKRDAEIHEDIEIHEDFEYQGNIEDIEEHDEYQDELEVEKEVDESDFLEKDSDEMQNETSSESTNSDNEDKTDDSIDKEDE